MKKLLLVFVLPIVLFGCSQSSNFSDNVSEKIKNNAYSLAVNELTDFEWNSLHIVRPYSFKTIEDTKIEQVDDSACKWVFVDAQEKLVEQFSINRSTVDCLDLPTKPFRKHEALFLIDDGKLKMRKVFKLNK